MTLSTLSHPAAEAKWLHISGQPINVAGLVSGAHHPAAGAVVIFSGETREINRGKEVLYLTYEANESLAEKMIAEILEFAKKKWGLSVAFAQHRIGRVDISECAVIVITASAHRSEAYTANSFIIDKIKHEVPIWKCEYYTDGSKEWGSNCNCSLITGDIHNHKYNT